MSKAMPKGRTLEEFQPLNSAEKALLVSCRNGVDLCLKIQEKIANKAPEETYTIRAEFLRFLALGGDDKNPVHEVGIRLYDALIKGILDLQSAVVSYDLPGFVNSFQQSHIFPIEINKLAATIS